MLQVSGVQAPQVVPRGAGWIRQSPPGAVLAPLLLVSGCSRGCGSCSRQQNLHSSCTQLGRGSAAWALQRRLRAV